MNKEQLINELLKAPFFEACTIGKAGKRAALEQGMQLFNDDEKIKAALEYLSEDAEGWEDLNDVLDKNNLPYIIYAADVFCQYELPSDLLQMWVEEFFFEKGEWQKKYKKAESMSAKAEAVYKSLEEFCNF